MERRKARVLPPTCLNDWPLDEFSSMPARGYPNATLVKMSGELDQRMLLSQTQGVQSGVQKPDADRQEKIAGALGVCQVP